jgi:hypothetical protein
MKEIHLGVLGINRRIILKWALKKYFNIPWTGLGWLRIWISSRLL